MILNNMYFQIVVFENVIETKLTLIKCSFRPFFNGSKEQVTVKLKNTVTIYRTLSRAKVLVKQICRLL